MEITKLMSYIGATEIGLLTVLTVFIALGFPLGEFTMGGKYKRIPKAMRPMIWGMLIIQIFAAIILLQTAQILPYWLGIKITRGICFFFAAYFSLNTVMNFFSNSMKEKLAMTPAAILAAACFWIVSLNA